jgi:hypothetical protein
MRPPTKPRRHRICTKLMRKLPRCRHRLTQNPDNSLLEKLCPKPLPDSSLPNVPARRPLQRESSVFLGTYPHLSPLQVHSAGRSNPIERRKLSPSTHAGGRRPPETGDLGQWHGTGEDMPKASRRRKHPVARPQSTACLRIIRCMHCPRSVC